MVPQSVLVVSEADSCLSFIQQPFGPLSQVAKLLHPAVSRQRALPKLRSGIFQGICQEMFRQNIQKHWKNVAEDIKIEDVCWVNRLKNKKVRITKCLKALASCNLQWLCSHRWPNGFLRLRLKTVLSRDHSLLCTRTCSHECRWRVGSKNSQKRPTAACPSSSNLLGHSRK